MSWLGRLIGRPARPDATASASLRTVVVPDDLAAALTADGTPLAVAVEAALRAHLAAAEREGVPFWLAREAGGGADIEEALRDRLAQRRAAEDGEEAGPAQRSPRRRRGL